MRSCFITLALVMATMLQQHVHAGQLMSHLIPGHRTHPGSNEERAPAPVSHLEWNSQVATGFDQRPMQPVQEGQAQPSPLDIQQQQQQPSGSNQRLAEVDCPTNDRVYLPDMQSFLIRIQMPHAEATAVCRACGSELLLVDGSNVDRLRESFQSLGGLYSGRQFWIKSWFGQRVAGAMCPAVEIDPLMDSR
ncbi:hypothetical protein BGZ73_003951, partial [Actinomortierella ambigua]